MRVHCLCSFVTSLLHRPFWNESQFLKLHSHAILTQAGILTEFGMYCFALLLYVPLNSYGCVGSVSSQNHIFFLGKLEQAVHQYFVHIRSLVTDSNPSWMNQRKGGIKLATPGSAVRLASVVRHVTDCPMRPSEIGLWRNVNSQGINSFTPFLVLMPWPWEK